MPDRYHIHTQPTPPRFRRVGKFGNVDWREDCSRCSNCVKHRCVFEVYRHEAAYNRDPLAPLETLDGCRACFSCVQGCTKGLLSLAVNPEYLNMGDEYWRPDILYSTWNQADAGRIPVSGAGYRGRFHGPGFDSIWTDMSEIVRPTRDGIHGREYISTSVDIGPKPMRLAFTADGQMMTPVSRLVEVQFPAILDLPAWPVRGGHLSAARAFAAKAVKSLAVVGAVEAVSLSEDLHRSIVLLLDGTPLDRCSALLAAAPMVQVEDGPDASRLAAEALAINPNLIVSVRTLMSPGSASHVVDLCRDGFKVIHLCADLHGREVVEDGRCGRHIKEALREVHSRLVREGLRDEITLIISGGIAMAEHMAKAIICGADLVGVDTSLLVALGCRVCRDAHRFGPNLESAASGACPAEISSEDIGYASQRMINLLGAWHSQLIEVLGAMGIREVRRLRGEVGRAIFVEDIEKEAFGDLARVPFP